MDIHEFFGHWTTIDRRDLATISSCIKLADYLFEEIATAHGPVHATNIFSKFGRATKMDERLYRYAEVLRRFRDSGRNKRQFVIQLTKRGPNKGKNPTSLYRKLNRHLKNPRLKPYIDHLDILEMNR